MSTTQRRAISPLLATVILIAICIAGGLMVYALFSTSMNTASSKAQLNVVSSQLESGSLILNVQNAGSKPVTSLAMTAPSSLTNSTEPTISPTPSAVAPLTPGQSASITVSYTGDTIGNSYTFVLTATFSDGSVFSYAVQVTDI
jgi:flagellin-like protein